MIIEERRLPMGTGQMLRIISLELCENRYVPMMDSCSTGQKVLYRQSKERCGN